MLLTEESQLRGSILCDGGPLVEIEDIEASSNPHCIPLITKLKGLDYSRVFHGASHLSIVTRRRYKLGFGPLRMMKAKQDLPEEDL